jgi:hypothetical protein
MVLALLSSINRIIITNIPAVKGASLISGRYERDEPPNWKEMISKLPVKVEQIKCKGKFIYFQCGDFYIFNTLGLSGGWSLSPSKAYNRVCIHTYVYIYIY